MQHGAFNDASRRLVRLLVVVQAFDDEVAGLNRAEAARVFGGIKTDLLVTDGKTERILRLNDRVLVDALRMRCGDEQPRKPSERRTASHLLRIVTGNQNPFQRVCRKPMLQPRNGDKNGKASAIPH